MTFLPNPLPNEIVTRLSNPTPYPEYLYLSIISVFLTYLTVPCKEFSSVG